MTLIPALLFIIAILVILLVAFVWSFFLLLRDQRELIQDYKWLLHAYNEAETRQTLARNDRVWLEEVSPSA